MSQAKAKKRSAGPSAADKVNRREDSSDVERAVYDGMQDLRVKKPAAKLRRRPNSSNG
jgi:hypothetical protein